MEELKMQHEVQKTGDSFNIEAPTGGFASVKKEIDGKVQLDGKSISINMILGPKEAKKPKREHENILKKQTHLHLEGKKIEIIENLQQCKSLTHVYLQENMIYTLVNDPFKGLDKII
jgi:hypothetical protein